MTELELFMYTFMAIGILFGIAIGYFYFNTFRLTSFLRQTLRKNYGIVYFYTKGKALMPKIVNFSKDILRTDKGLWVLYEGAIYRQVGREESQSNENVQQPIQQIEVDQPRGRFSFRKPKPLVVNVRLHRQIAAHDINYRQGVPIMFLGTEDMIPKYLADEFTTRIVRNPQMVEAVLGKEVAAAELEALKMTKKTIKWLIIAGIIMSLIGVGISYITLTKVQAVGDMVYNLTLNLQPILSAAAG